MLLSKKLNEFIFIHKKVRHEEFKYLRKDNNSYKARKEFLHMEVAVNLDWLSGEMKSPALYGRPDAGLSLNRFNQMVSELEIVAKRETRPFSGPKINRSDVEIREIKVSHDPRGAGIFSYE